jgi:hypothetical protein
MSKRETFPAAEAWKDWTRRLPRRYNHGIDRGAGDPLDEGVSPIMERVRLRAQEPERMSAPGRVTKEHRAWRTRLKKAHA